MTLARVHDDATLDERSFWMGSVPLRNRWFADSPLVGGVSSEPVSELGFFGARDLRPDSKTFVDDSGSVRGSFRTRIGRKLGFLYLGRPLLRCVLSY